MIISIWGRGSDEGEMTSEDTTIEQVGVEEFLQTLTQAGTNRWGQLGLGLAPHKLSLTQGKDLRDFDAVT